MPLSPMRYKNFTWPHNPETYTISYQRNVAVLKNPLDRYVTQDLGLGHRVMQGEGVFFGGDAYDTFSQLASVFYDNGPGILIHPVWQTTHAYFVKLSLAQEPLPDYVRYRFMFWEQEPSPDSTKAVFSKTEEPAALPSPRFHTVKRGDCLWSIAQNYNCTMETILALNPSIKNPNLILPGEQVRIQ